MTWHESQTQIIFIVNKSHIALHHHPLPLFTYLLSRPDCDWIELKLHGHGLPSSTARTKGKKRRGKKVNRPRVEAEWRKRINSRARVVGIKPKEKKLRNRNEKKKKQIHSNWTPNERRYRMDFRKNEKETLFVCVRAEKFDSPKMLMRQRYTTMSETVINKKKKNK